MAYNERLTERIRGILTGLRLPVQEKRMMGGLCFMVRGKMCVGVVGDRLMARIDPTQERDAMARPGCRVMDFTGRPMRGFVFVAREGWGAARDLEYWLKLALDFNPSAKSSKKNSKRTIGNEDRQIFPLSSKKGIRREPNPVKRP